MVKYVKEDTQVTFAEIPDEITLVINVSNCPHHCKGCHSQYLQTDIGDELTFEVLDELIKKNEGITCVSFMGEGNDLNGIFLLGTYIKNEYPDLKVALYTGLEDIPQRFVEYFDYLKLGPYIEKFGPLDKETTNQRMFKREGDGMALIGYKWQSGWSDITYKFWNKKI